jgi:aspartyl protease family protein
MGAWIALTLLVIAGLALLLRADAGSIAGFDPSDFAIAVACVALLIFLGSSIAGSYRGRAGHAVRDLLTWTLVALLLVAGYSYREEIFSLGHRVVGELLPPASARCASGGDPMGISLLRRKSTACP